MCSLLPSNESILEERPASTDGECWARPRRVAAGEDDDELRGQISKRFSLKGTIGKGTTGVVYRAKRRADGKQVALKVIHPSAKLQREALEEYERLQLLQQPHINRALDFFVAGGISVLVLELVQGLQLPAAVEQAPGGRLMELNARELCTMLLQAVGHIHDKGLVHGDVKPPDVLVSEDLCQLKLVDLGSAFEAPGPFNNRPPQVSSTLQMTMAPEVLLGEPPSKCSDMWQVGLCLFLMLAGKLPQERDSQEASESSKPVLRRHISIREPRLWHLSESCKSALRHCLAVDKHERPTPEQLLAGEWIRSRARAESGGQAAEAPEEAAPALGRCLLLPGLEPAGRPRSTRPSSARPRGARHERRLISASAQLEKLAAPLSQTSTQPSSCASLRAGPSLDSLPASEPPPGASAVEDRPTVEILRPRTEVAKVLLANRLDGTYKVRMNDGSIQIVKAEDAHPLFAVEMVQPKREFAKVLLANRMDGTYKVRLADGSTRMVNAEDVEGGPSSSDGPPAFVEVLQPRRETAQVLLASRMDGTYKVRMWDGSVKTVNAEEVHAGAASSDC